MACWACVDKNGTERIMLKKPERWGNGIKRWTTPGVRSGALPKGSIKKLIGRELSWSDKPVELKDSSV